MKKPGGHAGQTMVKGLIPFMKKPGESVIFKSIAAIIVPLVILALVVSLVGYRSFTDGMLEMYEQGAVEIARTAAAVVDADQLDGFVASGGNTEDYRETWNKLDLLCNSSGATFIYVIRPDQADYGHITFLFSTINRESPYSVYEFGYYRETTNDDYRVKYRALYDGASSSEIVIRDRGYIETDTHITAMVPLKGSDGKTQAILCVQRQMDRLNSVRNRFVRMVMVLLFALVVIIIVAQHFYLRRELLNPLRKISDESVRFAAEGTPAEVKLADVIRNRDEIGKLAGSIDRMEEQVARYVDQLTRVTAEKERIGTELSLANRIQAGMLPRIFPAFPDRRDFDIYASMTPAKEVGGDFYDFFLIDHDHLALVMADVSGKGVPAALFMMACKIMIHNIAMTGVSPRQILETTNNRICQNNNQEMFVTVWLGILDLRTGQMTAVNAGHEYPVVTRSGGGFELLKDRHGFVVGGLEGITYKEYELKLEPGQELFLYTDGVPEATNADKELYGTGRMMRILNSNPHLEPQQVLEKVKADVDSFVGCEPQFDDLTMLCLKYNGPQ